MHLYSLIAASKKLSKTEVEKRTQLILAKIRREPRFQKQRERDVLIKAIQYGSSDMAHSLLAKGVDPNSREPKGRSALWHAAHWGRGTVIRDLVKRGAQLPDDVLMGPVHDGDVETVRFLIKHGANVNCVAIFTRYRWKFPKKEVLLTVAIDNVLAKKIAEKAAQNIRKLMSPQWRKSHPPTPPYGDLESIPIMLIKAGADVNRLAFEYSVYEGYIPTVLGWAAHYGLVKTIKAMLAAGAKENQRDTWGGTALLDAARGGHRNVIKIFLAAGAKTDIKRRDGATPVSTACDHGFIDLANDLERLSKSG